jgi:dihydrofolate reductase
VIGGTTLFAETLPLADVIHLTEVEADVEGDTWFPAFDRREWSEREVARQPADDRHAYPIRILELTRKESGRGG